MPNQKVISIEKAWEILFENNNIIENIKRDNIYRISAAAINTIKEARLMAKFDQSSQLPKIFKDNNLSILPVTRGEYIISTFKTHETVDYGNIIPQKIEMPNLETLDYTNLYSEAAALLFAFNSGIIADVMCDSEIFYTVNGRMSSGIFTYNIYNPNYVNNKQYINVFNSQIEIDGGYESLNKFCICEAKNVAVEEILIRQLYYPYRLWENKITKPIIPVLLIHSNDIFHTFIYKFTDRDDYNSIKLVEHKAYTYEDEEITLNEIHDLWSSIKILPEPDVTFPQADSFMRIIDLLSILYEKRLTRDEVTLKYEFDTRQTTYYISACEYLGLIERDINSNGERVYQLNSEARKIMSYKHKHKYMELIKNILQRKVFNETFYIALQCADVPDKDIICKIMSQAGLNINTTTIERRSSTVRGWINWILEQGITD